MAVDLPCCECPRKDSEAPVEVIERAEARETLTQAQIKESIDNAVIAMRNCRHPLFGLDDLKRKRLAVNLRR
jgi:hypothetical protein